MNDQVLNNTYTHTIYLYVLQLEYNKFYIGRTENVDKRVADHILGNGSEWTRLYRVMCLLEWHVLTDVFDEDKYVKKYMNLYGIDNVRGGSYSKTILSKEQKKFIKAELKTVNNQCYRCGSIDHYVRNCNN